MNPKHSAFQDNEIWLSAAPRIPAYLPLLLLLLRSQDNCHAVTLPL